MAPAVEADGIEMAPSPTTVMSWSGRALMTVGSLMLAFAVFQLWGTGVAESRAQDELSRQLAADLAAASPVGDGPAVIRSSVAVDDTDSASTNDIDTIDLAAGRPVPQKIRRSDAESSESSDGGGPASPTVLAPGRPDTGRAAGRITIPAIGVDKVFVEGVDRNSLRLGPGRFPGSSWPGHQGNAAIAGHRTTHGAPFLDLDRLRPGDEILVETVEGRFRYLVEGHNRADGTEVGHRIVAPTRIDVLDDQGDSRLTLTACHPRYSAAQRIVVSAVLDGSPLPGTGRDLKDADLGEVSDVSGDGYTEADADYPVSGDNTGTDNNLGDDSDADSARNGVGDSDDQVLAFDDGTESAATGRELDSVYMAGDEDGQVDDVAAGEDVGDDLSLHWQMGYLAPTLIGALATALVAALAAMATRRWNRILVLAAASGPFLICLFWWFTNMDKLLPAV